MSGAHLRVRVGGEQYALAVESVREVDLIGELTPVPGAPSAVLGVRNLRGTIIPVLDLAALINAGGHGQPTTIAVVEEDGRLAGLAIDQPLEVERLSGSRQDAEAPFLQGVVLSDEALVGVLDLRALLDAVQEASG